MSKKLNLNNLGVLNKLASYINSVPKDSSDYAISSYLIKNIYNINNIGISDIIDDCYVSVSSIRRFCNDIGYNNFSDLRTSLNDIIYPSNIHLREFTSIDVYRKNLENEIYTRIKLMNNIITNDVVINLCERIDYYDEVFFLCPNNTTGNLVRFQQEMFSVNKIIHIISSNFNYEFNSNVETIKNGLLVVISVSGVFADSIQDIISKNDNLYKILITSNLKDNYIQTYNEVIKILDESIDNDKYGIISKYGVTFLFDLLSEQYIYMKRNSK